MILAVPDRNKSRRASGVALVQLISMKNGIFGFVMVIQAELVSVIKELNSSCNSTLWSLFCRGFTSHQSLLISYQVPLVFEYRINGCQNAVEVQQTVGYYEQLPTFKLRIAFKTLFSEQARDSRVLVQLYHIPSNPFC
ncbi:hypothetical protein V6N13_011149 [Hibiscus sabdariffa]